MNGFLADLDRTRAELSKDELARQECEDRQIAEVAQAGTAKRRAAQVEELKQLAAELQALSEVWPFGERHPPSRQAASQLLSASLNPTHPLQMEIERAKGQREGLAMFANEQRVELARRYAMLEEELNARREVGGWSEGLFVSTSPSTSPTLVFFFKFPNSGAMRTTAKRSRQMSATTAHVGGREGGWGWGGGGGFAACGSDAGWLSISIPLQTGRRGWSMRASILPTCRRRATWLCAACSTRWASSTLPVGGRCGRGARTCTRPHSSSLVPKGLFAKHHVDAVVMQALSDDDLASIGVAAVGDRKRILRGIADFFSVDVKKPAAGGTSSKAAAGEAGAAAGPARTPAAGLVDTGGVHMECVVCLDQAVGVGVLGRELRSP